MLHGADIVAHCAEQHGVAHYRALLEACALGGERLLLGVYADNARARTFYERYGFRHVADRRFRVGTHAYDDIVLARAL